MSETCGKCGGVHEPAGKALYLAVRDRHRTGEIILPAFRFRGTGKGFAVAPARV